MKQFKTPMINCKRNTCFIAKDGLDEHYGTISMKELYKTISENIVYDGLDLSFLYVKEI